MRWAPEFGPEAKLWRCGEEGVKTTLENHSQMKAKRRRHDPQFKARVALEALKGVKTIQEIAREYEVHPVQVSDWKKAIQEGVSSVFERSGQEGTPREFEREREQLKAIIGDLTVKLEFMTKKSKQLGL